MEEEWNDDGCVVVACLTVQLLALSASPDSVRPSCPGAAPRPPSSARSRALPLLHPSSSSLHIHAPMSFLAHRVSSSLRQSHACALVCARGLSTAAAAVESTPVAAVESAPTPAPRLFISRNRVSYTLPKVKKGASGGKSKTVLYPLETALGLSQSLANAGFDETISVTVRLNLDPRKPNQSVRGAATLPNGTGKQVRVAVFAKGEKAQEARAAGADVVGEKDLVDSVRQQKDKDAIQNRNRCVVGESMF